MNFFEKELRKVFWGDDMIGSPFYVDGVCFGTLGRDYLVQIEFATSQVNGQFDVLKIVVAHRINGQPNIYEIPLKVILEDKVIYRGLEGTSLPYMWIDKKFKVAQLTWSERQQLREAVVRRLEPFCEQQSNQCESLKLVYICAPLRGDVEQNIEFARQQAREVFQTGEVPICPHLMFPPIADPGDPNEDQAAREMGLRLLTLCQQVNVYGVCTAGMQEEIDLARRLSIPVKVIEGTCP